MGRYGGCVRVRAVSAPCAFVLMSTSRSPFWPRPSGARIATAAHHARDCRVADCPGNPSASQATGPRFSAHFMCFRCRCRCRVSYLGQTPCRRSSQSHPDKNCHRRWHEGGKLLSRQHAPSGYLGVSSGCILCIWGVLGVSKGNLSAARPRSHAAMRAASAPCFGRWLVGQWSKCGCRFTVSSAMHPAAWDGSRAPVSCLPATDQNNFGPFGFLALSEHNKAQVHDKGC